jgi:hypothetical protein
VGTVRLRTKGHRVCLYLFTTGLPLQFRTKWNWCDGVPWLAARADCIPQFLSVSIDGLRPVVSAQTQHLPKGATPVTGPTDAVYRIAFSSSGLPPACEVLGRCVCPQRSLHAPATACPKSASCWVPFVLAVKSSWLLTQRSQVRFPGAARFSE